MPFKHLLVYIAANASNEKQKLNDKKQMEITDSTRTEFEKNDDKKIDMEGGIFCFS